MKRMTTYDLTTEQGRADFEAHMERNRKEGRDSILVDTSEPGTEDKVRDMMFEDFNNTVV